MSITVFLVEAEHYSIPGVATHTFRTKAKAEAKAAELVNSIAADFVTTFEVEEFETATAENWERIIQEVDEGVREYLGDDECYVIIRELRLED